MLIRIDCGRFGCNRLHVMHVVPFAQQIRLHLSLAFRISNVKRRLVRLVAHAHGGASVNQRTHRAQRPLQRRRKVDFGDPLDPRTQVGAIVSPAHLQKIDAYVREATQAGAKVELGYH